MWEKYYEFNGYHQLWNKWRGCTWWQNLHFDYICWPYVQCVNLQGHLYLLVTDQGFLQEESVVWESLHNVEGDGNFCDSDFRLCHPSQKPSATSQPSAQQQQQMQINQVIKVLPAFSYHIVVISLTCSTFSWSNQIPKQNKSPFLPNDYAVSLRNI